MNLGQRRRSLVEPVSLRLPLPRFFLKRRSFRSLWSPSFHCRFPCTGAEVCNRPMWALISGDLGLDRRDQRAHPSGHIPQPRQLSFPAPIFERPVLPIANPFLSRRASRSTPRITTARPLIDVSAALREPISPHSMIFTILPLTRRDRRYASNTAIEVLSDREEFAASPSHRRPRPCTSSSQADPQPCRRSYDVLGRVAANVPRHFFEQTRTVPRIDGDLYTEARRRLRAVPTDTRRERSGPLQRLYVRAVLVG